MKVRSIPWAAVAAVATFAAAGCHHDANCKLSPVDRTHYRTVATQIEYPDVCTTINPNVVGALAPRTIRDGEPTDYWELSLQEALQVALANSDIMRDLGARVITAPAATPSTFDPAIQESDPNFGVEGALSAFDAQLSSSLFWQKNDRPANFLIPIAGGGSLFAPIFEQDLANYTGEVSKFTAAGTQFSFRNNTTYEFNNNRSNRFPSVYNTMMEAEFRQPLLRGAGIEYNRIAGPNGANTYQFNGVLIARVNYDITLANFEASVRDFVSNVENAYWDLYYAYRDLDAKLAGRNATLETWRRINTLAEFGARGGNPEQEAQAREQYFQFQALVEDALSGRRAGSTQSGGIAGGGQLTGTGGVYAREQNLRFIMGLPINDGRMIRPNIEPTAAPIAFDWDLIVGESLVRRVELRQQKWLIKRREMELLAANNLVRPQLDAAALYRWRGFGDHLWKAGGDHPEFDNAVESLTGGNYQEWEMGFNFSMPIGFRQAMAAVRQAEWNLSRDRAMLSNQELQVVHNLGSAIRELDRAHRLAHTNFNRRIAAQQEVEVVRAAYEEGVAGVTLDVLLEAQRRQAEAESEFYRSLVEYNLAIKGVHYEKGTLLDYDGVTLAEGPWPRQAYRDARELARRFRTRKFNYAMRVPQCFSRGRFQQDPLGSVVIDRSGEPGPTPAPASPERTEPPVPTLDPGAAAESAQTTTPVESTQPVESPTPAMSTDGPVIRGPVARRPLDNIPPAPREARRERTERPATSSTLVLRGGESSSAASTTATSESPQTDAGRTSPSAPAVKPAPESARPVARQQQPQRDAILPARFEELIPTTPASEGETTTLRIREIE